MVFFTRRGIPGEVDEGMDSTTGAMAACMRALKASGAFSTSPMRSPYASTHAAAAADFLLH